MGRLILVIMFSLWLPFGKVDCCEAGTATLSNANQKQNQILIGWIFSVETKMGVNDVEVPETKIHIFIGKSKTFLGRFTGYPAEVTDFEKAKFPIRALMGCKVWFGGAGQDIYVARKNDSIIEVFARDIDESGGVLASFKKIKEITVPKKGNLVVVKAYTVTSK